MSLWKEPHARTSTLLAAVEWVFWLTALVSGVLDEEFTAWMGLGLILLAGSSLARAKRLGIFSRTTGLELPLLLLLVSGCISVWVAPDRLLAAARLYLYLVGTALYFSLANSSQRSTSVFLRLFAVVAAVGGVFFASQIDWGRFDARFALVQQWGSLLNVIIPRLGVAEDFWAVFRNITAAVLTVAIPAAVYWLYQAVQQARSGAADRAAHVGLLLSAVINILLLFGLLMTESRTPWLAFLFAGLIWGWRSLAGKLTRGVGQGFPVFWAGVLVTTLVAVVLLVSTPAFAQILSNLPGPESMSSRIYVNGQAWRLAQAVPFTGGGLGSFAGLYSTYIAVIPFRAFYNEDTGVNAFLSILVEQGWPGALAVGFLFVIAFWQISAQWKLGPAHSQALLNLGAVSLFLLLFHGLSHATLAATRAIPVFFIPFGIAAAGSAAAETVAKGDLNRLYRPAAAPRLALLVFVALIGSSFLLNGRLLAARWYVNLGAIRAARVELADYPRQTWDVGDDLASLEPAAANFQKALELDPDQGIAHAYLGRMALKGLDFAKAVDHLEAAYRQDQGHLGVIKELAYSYVWSGDFDRALPLLRLVPEAQTELQAYIHWWMGKGYELLAEKALQGVERLK